MGGAGPSHTALVSLTAAKMCAYCPVFSSSGTTMNTTVPASLASLEFVRSLKMLSYSITWYEYDVSGSNSCPR